MNLLYEIEIPERSNDGAHLIEERRMFLNRVESVSGGYTQEPDVTGVWDSKGRRFHECMTPVLFMGHLKAIRKAFAQCFPDQKAAFIVKRGVAKIVKGWPR